MAVTLKRVSGEVIEPLIAPPVEEAEKQPDIDYEALRAASARQLAEWRGQAAVFMQRYGKGAALWVERGWTWEEPDWTADPETWPPLARLAYLWHRSRHALNRANWLRHFSERPEWCSECEPAKPSPQHMAANCIEKHVDHAEAVKAIARDMGWRE